MIDIVLKREEKETVGVLLIPSWNTKGKYKTLAELLHFCEAKTSPINKKEKAI